jgi:hypothetical protein
MSRGTLHPRTQGWNEAASPYSAISLLEQHKVAKWVRCTILLAGFNVMVLVPRKIVVSAGMCLVTSLSGFSSLSSVYALTRLIIYHGYENVTLWSTRYVYVFCSSSAGTRQCSWLRRYAASWKDADWSPDEAITCFFSNPSSFTTARGLIRASNRNEAQKFSRRGGVKARPACKAYDLSRHLWAHSLKRVVSSTSC